MAAKCRAFDQRTTDSVAENQVDDFYAQSSALQQQLVTKRYEYNALLAANPPDSSKINAVAKEMENLRQSLDAYGKTGYCDG